MTLSPAFVTAFANMAVRRLPHSHVLIHRPGIRWPCGFESWVGRCGRVNPPPTLEGCGCQNRGDTHVHCSVMNASFSPLINVQ
jgi:hypothetical protein